MKMEKIEKLVPDTSIIIEGLLSQKLEKKELKVDELIVHEAILAELEHQANVGRTTGNIGLEELKKLKSLADILLGLSAKDIVRLIKLGEMYEVNDHV